LLAGCVGDRWISPSSLSRASPGTRRFASRVAAPRGAEGEAWWSQTGSNRRPHACKARALPAELWPRTRRRKARRRASSRSPSPHSALKTRANALNGLRRSSLRRGRLAWPKRRARRLVGLGRLELPTSRLSSARSNQLSYKPLTLFPKKGSEACSRATGPRQCIARAQPPSSVFVREERETKTAKSRLWSSTIPRLLAPDVSKTIR
jgi:hypothetical protein